MERWQRTLWVTAIAQTLSILGFSFVTPFLPLYIQQLGIHGVTRVTVWAAILSGGTAVAMAITAPIWGVLADRHGRKIMVVRSMFSAALLIGLMGLAQNVYHLLLLRVLQGMFTGTVSAAQALVASQSPRDRLGFSLGVMQTAVFVGTSLGPLAGGLAADAVGFRLSFVVGGVILSLGGVLVTLFVQEEARFAEKKSTPHPGFVAGVRQSLKTPALLPMIGAIFAVQFGLTVVFPILPQFIQYLQGPGGHAATVTGLIFTAAGAAGAISSLAVGSVSDRVGYKAVLVAAAGAAAVLSVPQYFVNSTWQLAALRIAIGFAMGALMPSASALIASLVPAERRGTAYGLTGSATSIGFAAGPLTAAGVVAVSGMRPVFLTAAVLLGAISVWVSLAVHVPDEPVEDLQSTVTNETRLRGVAASPGVREPEPVGGHDRD
jgi:DHA1 family multidrug resistance protein-like MFS transporter